MSRAHNFSAGPAVLPLSVVNALSEALPEFQDTRQGLMELSHRSPAFDGVCESAKARMRRLLAIPDDYEILLLQGGASLQFYMTALNLTAPDEKADFLMTGTWSSKAIKEAGRVCDAARAWDGAETGHTRVPSQGDYTVRQDAKYLHYTSNNTIYGTQFHALPDPAGAQLVADLSSDICSRPIDVAAHAVIYAGAQKNLGPSGVTAVILSPWAVEQSRNAGQSRPGGLPSMLDYGLMVDKKSLFNTPNTFGIYALERVLAWVEDQGGLQAMQTHNTNKANMLYAELDRSEFWQPHAEHNSRSQMNVTWRLADPDLVPAFLDGAAKAELVALKGHRSVGGIRASIYNACPAESVEALVSFMVEFERTRG